MEYLLQDWSYAGLVGVGVIWGLTNPFMEYGQKNKQQEIKLDLSWGSFINMFMRISFLIPFILNQLGSLLYYKMLGEQNVTVASMISNSVACVITYITESILNRQTINIQGLLGIILVIIGVSLCLN